MEFNAFLARVIDDGIEAARRDYKRPEQKSKLEGSIEGFEACRDKSPAELADLLQKAHVRAQTAYFRVNEKEISDEEYWKVRCFEAEVEWTCNCVSAILMNEGKPVIVNPTARGVLKAAEVVGVRKEH